MSDIFYYSSPPILGLVAYFQFPKGQRTQEKWLPLSPPQSSLLSLPHLFTASSSTKSFLFPMLYPHPSFLPTKPQSLFPNTYAAALPMATTGGAASQFVQNPKMAWMLFAITTSTFSLSALAAAVSVPLGSLPISALRSLSASYRSQPSRPRQLEALVERKFCMDVYLSFAQ